MNNRVFISEEELKKYGDINNFSEKAEALLNHQKEHWELLKNNFEALKSVKVRKYDFKDFEIRTQFNPSRIISSSAKVDQKSISERPCFLCEKNLPDVQKGIKFNNHYTLLCNPFPIFSQHLTIPHHEHIPQEIETSFEDLLKLSYELKDNFMVFYNGPKCGASAPDHLHFQAGKKGSTPLEYYHPILFKNGMTLIKKDNLSLKQVSSGFLTILILRSNKASEISSTFFKIVENLKKKQETAEEPLLNIISLFEKNKWNIFIFPRKAHRPREYFLEGEKKILISPASADMAGLLITPKENDYNTLTETQIADIYTQVLYNNAEINNYFQDLS